MNSKIEKIDRELEKARDRPPNGRPKCGSWNGSGRRRKTARSCSGALPEAHARRSWPAFFQNPANLTASGQVGPKSTNKSKEESAHED